ncbi:uncharacterized protein C3orf30 homolog [Otolemur garnettii]|uniref:uncharacterized protein C3orf30 homolog n=1 Tax=Otolemur garnettii TaxID=30611 RepID=UPI000C7EC68D|nr:uncharacterized protein C3orf30 homolog [Otolemur garnettii]
MEEPPKEARGEYREPESTDVPSAADYTDGQGEDDQKNQAEGEAHDQTDYRIAGESASKVSDQAEANTVGQADDKVSERHGLNTSGQAEHSGSNLVNVADLTARDLAGEEAAEQEQIEDNKVLPKGETPEETERRWSILSDRKTSLQTDHLMSTEDDRLDYEQSRPSEWTDGMLSLPSDQRASEQLDHRIQAEKRTHEQIDYRLSGLVGQKPNTRYQPPQLPAGQDDQLPVKTDSSDSDEIHHLLDKQDYQKDEYPSDDDMLGQTEDSEDKGADSTELPFHSEDSQIDLNFKLSDEVENEIERTSRSQAYHPANAKITSNVQADQNLTQESLSTSSKEDNITNQENTQAIESSPVKPPHFEQEKSSHIHDQSYKKGFPPVVYEDPYEVSLQYMEKHRILQIFQQITENLVYAKPEDPLYFMLCQVWNRSKKATFSFLSL